MSTAYNRCRRKPPLNRGRDNDGGGLGLGALPPAQVFSLRPLRNFFAIFAVKLFPETHLTAKFAEEGRQRSRSEMLRFDAGFCPRPSRLPCLVLLWLNVRAVWPKIVAPGCHLW